MRCYTKYLCVFGLLLCLTAGIGFAQQTDLLRDISNAQAAVYEKVAPSVVRIITSQQHPEMDLLREFPLMPFMFPPGSGEEMPFEFRFKGQPGPGNQQEDSEGESNTKKKKPNFMISGVGSGVIIKLTDNDAWILTNSHVLGDSDKVHIEFRDAIPLADLELIRDEKSDKRNVYLDKRSDLALVKLPKSILENRTLVAAEFGDSDSLKVGELVFTLGAPLNREQTFSQGIISAMDRSNVFPDQREDVRYEGLIQTTAFINVGNSGGPLLNSEGKVVGINVAIQTAGGFSNGFIGIGFAIPSNRARFVTDQIVAQGTITRGWLGVAISLPALEDREYFNLPPRSGVQLGDVMADGPAAKSGLMKKDIILSYDGIPVRSPTHLQDLVAPTQVGKTVKLEVLRSGEKVEIPVTIGKQPDEPLSVASLDGAANVPEFGANLRDLNEEEQKYFKDMGFTGVLVDKADETGPLGKKGIQKGALITEIENIKVTTVAEVKKVVDTIRKQNANKREILVMVKYVPASAGNTETFQVIKLDLSGQ